MDGGGSAGISSTYARGDHQHPSDTAKQDLLVSGSNIKTINNLSLLGSGNINISGLEMYLLWTNASPTSAFNSQTLTIDLTDYELIVIEALAYITSSPNNGIFSSIFKKEIGVTYGIVTHYNNNTGDGGVRNITFSNSSIEISASNLNNNSYCIPYKIYGIK